MTQPPTDKLAQIFSSIRDEREMRVFLEGMLTPSELEEVICRWQLMLRLLAGEPQREISQELGVSLGKISRGSRLLKYGPDEFRQLLERLTAEVESPQ
jgi:TrpR family trp operon transcriptional repressor